MPQSKEVKREQAKLRKQRQRDKERDIGERDTNSVTQYPAILHALTDPIKRKRLEKIYHSLNEHGVTKMLRYGYYGPSFDIVGELLEATR